MDSAVLASGLQAGTGARMRSSHPEASKLFQRAICSMSLAVSALLTYMLKLELVAFGGAAILSTIGLLFWLLSRCQRSRIELVTSCLFVSTLSVSFLFCGFNRFSVNLLALNIAIIVCLEVVLKIFAKRFDHWGIAALIIFGGLITASIVQNSYSSI
ncbi:MAG: hypothetical protein KF784_15250 [Fimbriimonadaceae bacterium]|nr:hypothetical protein [Fimbriimonadaceae bacterium]